MSPTCSARLQGAARGARRSPLGRSPVEDLAHLVPLGGGTGPWTKWLVTSSTSAPARARAAQSERSYGGVYAGGSTTWTRIGQDSRGGALLLRGQHQRARAPARVPRRDPARPIRRKLEHEILVLDNASDDGSAEAVEADSGEVRAHHARPTRRPGREQLAHHAARRAASSACSSTRTPRSCPGRCAALLEALERDRGAAIAGRSARSTPTASRFRARGGSRASETALAQALFLHRRLVTARATAATAAAQVGWVQSCAMLVRREAADRSAI